MNFERVEGIAEAVLYEGYMLYPYRPSSVKNHHRFNFGVLCPRGYCESESGSESWSMQTECLAKVKPHARITVKVRCLQIVKRSIRRYEQLGASSATVLGQPEFVDRLEVDGRVYQPWQEAVERTFTSGAFDPASLVTECTIQFGFLGGESVEQLHDACGNLVGEIVRRGDTVTASLRLSSQAYPDDVIRFRVCVENRTDFVPGTCDSPRDAALPHSLVSAHAILGVEGGEFLSLLDPPPGFEELAQGCVNRGVWPVLAGHDATTVLASPIILYDYPQIAPESAGNLFDATEIDEILSLRILALTDEEKAEIRRADERARQLLERTENISEKQFKTLHGALRGATALQEGPQ